MELWNCSHFTGVDGGRGGPKKKGEWPPASPLEELLEMCMTLWGNTGFSRSLTIVNGT